MGTSNICHKKELGVRWGNGYGHDWVFIKNLMFFYFNYQKIKNKSYIVCHIPKKLDV